MPHKFVYKNGQKYAVPVVSYIVVNKSGKNALGNESFTTKISAERAILDMIAGARSTGNSAASLKYYRELSVHKK